MLKPVIYIFLLMLTICCADKQNNMFTLDPTLRKQFLDHPKGATTRELAISDFSIVKGKQNYFNTYNLENCTCELIGDTLKISLGYYSESGASAVFEVINKHYNSYILLWSDVPEYDGNYEMIINSETDNLILSQDQFNPADSLIGKFYNKSRLVDFIHSSTVIENKGMFQCIIQ